MLFFGHITDADLDVAVHSDPSTDFTAWQQGAQTIEEFFGPDGTFWSEPITPDDRYIAKDNVNTSGEAGSGIGTSSGNELGIGTSSGDNIGSDAAISDGVGGAMNELNIKSSTDNLQVHTTAVNATPKYYYVPHDSSKSYSDFDPELKQSTTYNPSPPTAQKTKRRPGKHPSPTMEIKPPTKHEKMNAELSYPITPQLGKPYVRGRTTSATKGAKQMRREMEEQELEQVKPPVKRVSSDLNDDEGDKSPVRSRKQPKRAAKSKKN